MSIDRLDISSLPRILSVRVKNPETTVFEGMACAVTTANTNGRLDIVPFHTHFISLFTGEVIIHTSSTEKIQLPIKGGIMKVFENTVSIYLGIPVSTAGKR
jgi:F0F1-type ATP synthase epsilon subunit